MVFQWKNYLKTALHFLKMCTAESLSSLMLDPLIFSDLLPNKAIWALTINTSRGL